jgi:hypothetical protein
MTVVNLTGIHTSAPLVYHIVMTGLSDGCFIELTLFAMHLRNLGIL